MAVWTYPQIDPIVFELGPLAIRWYGLAYIAGFLGAIWVVSRLNRRWKLGLTSSDLTDILIGAAVGVMVGARLGYIVAYNLVYYLENPTEIIAVWDGGMSFHGGLIGTLVAAVVVSRRLPISFLRLCDLGAIGVPVGLFFGRLANFFNGALWGRTSDEYLLDASQTAEIYELTYVTKKPLARRLAAGIRAVGDSAQGLWWQRRNDARYSVS